MAFGHILQRETGLMNSEEGINRTK